MPSLIDNPIAYAQFKLRGGWRNTLTVTAIYFVALAGVIITTVRVSSPNDRTEVLNGWSVGLLVIEAGLLLVFGASRVSAAIRRDITQGLVESHQLMPVSGTTAVLGYLLGAGAQAFVMTLATMAIGVVTAHAAGVDFYRYAGANVTLILFTIFVWVLAAFSAFLMKGGLGLFVSLVFGTMTVGQFIYTLLPGARVLATPVLAGVIFSGRTSLDFVPWAYGVSVMAQAFVGTVCFIGAARKYRRGEDAALGPMVGLALLAGWVAISAIGIVYAGEFDGAMGSRDNSAHPQFVAAIVSAMLLAIVPIASSAWTATEYRRHKLEDDPRPMPRPMPLPAVIAVATALILPLTLARVPADVAAIAWDSDGFSLNRLADPGLAPLVATAIVFASFLAGLGYLLRWTYSAVPKALVIGSIWVGVTWLLPLLVDYMIVEIGDGVGPSPARPIASISPLGAIMQIWDVDAGTSYYPGIAVQVLLAAIAVFIYHRSAAKSGRAISENSGKS